MLYRTILFLFYLLPVLTNTITKNFSHDNCLQTNIKKPYIPVLWTSGGCYYYNQVTKENTEDLHLVLKNEQI